ncbi:hypothetical protein AK88_05424 [Plasmodium fragile]|uniref:Schizont-infected cell agglutination C-terminal domain-containing protein n=1 Tax=Plasmodium fragile TaxID=5857 RepID=A0A0D9QGU5_PLAFR|nr:uncharacterized protein AK88_05424 [Plasmodium fragile]KJP84946.1 hypothetical protein AK88_05424 [Plasmodium fragile]
MQRQLQIFIQHMNDDSEYDNAINCGNAYWEHPTEDGTSGQSPRRMDRSKERVICRLMTQAIYFANAWSSAVKANIEGNSKNDREIKGLIWCTIVDIYQEILWIYGCEGHWGTYYAWYTTQIIWDELKTQLGENNCKRGKYKDIKLGYWPMRNQMKRWLQENKQMQDKLEKEQISDGCKGAQVKLEVGTGKEEQQKDKDNHTKHEIRQDVKDILGDVKKEMEKEEDQLRGSTDPAPQYPAVEEAEKEKDAEIEQHMKGKIADVEEKLKPVIAKNAAAQAAAAKTAGKTRSEASQATKPDAPTPPAAKPAATKPATTTPVEAAPAGRSEEAGDPPQPSPAPVSPQAEPAGQPGEVGGQGPGPGQQPPPPPPQTHNTSTSNTGAQAPDKGTGTTTPETGKEGVPCNENTDGSSILGSKPQVQADPIDYSLGGHGSVTMVIVTPQTPKKCPGNGISDPTTTESTEQTVPAAAPAPGQAAQPEATPSSSPAAAGGPPAAPSTAANTEKDNVQTTPSFPSSTNAHGAPGPSGPTGENGEAGNSGGRAGADGGNDDPPPLNPTKPKPNPNPDQSGSSGGTSGDAQIPGSAPSAGTQGGAGGQTSAGAGGGGGGGAEGTPGISGEANGSVPGAGGIVPGVPGLGGVPGVRTPASPETVPPGPARPSGGTGSSSGPVSGTEAKDSGTLDTGKNDDKRQTDDPGILPIPEVPVWNWDDLIKYVPALIPAVVGIGLIALFLWKYFAYLDKRRRTYRTVRDVPSPPLDEEILQHLQRGEPPPDYGHTMIRDRQPASAAERRGQRPPRVHKRTIIELHLEVLNECEAAEWENVKDDYLQILVDAFIRGTHGHSSSPDAPITNQDLSRNNVSSTVDPPTDIDGTDPCPPNEDDPWSCMETIQLATARSPPNEDNPDPWSCMETIELATDRCPPHDSVLCPLRADANSAPDHNHWIPWIDRNKHLLRECTTQPWFLQLKAEWKQYLREHIAANEVSGQRALGEHRSTACVEMKTDAWKQWVEQQHRQKNVDRQEAWFKHLLHNVEEETVRGKGEVPAVDTDVEVEKVMAAQHMLRVRDIPRTQLHQPPHMNTPLTAKIWILILALVIEQCEVERSLQEKELYVDALLQL